MTFENVQVSREAHVVHALRMIEAEARTLAAGKKHGTDILSGKCS